jgi:hypothetical protein
MRETVRVKISSDAAGAIALTPVVVQEMSPVELTGHMLNVCGKDRARVRELMKRGSMVDGASRFRWEGWDVEDGELEELLRHFPDADPSRPFSFDDCAAVVLHSGAQQIPIPRAAAEKRRLFQRRSLWKALEQFAFQVSYCGYSYRGKADVYRAILGGPEQTILRESAKLVPYSTIERQIETHQVESIDFHVPR